MLLSAAYCIRHLDSWSVQHDPTLGVQLPNHYIVIATVVVVIVIVISHAEIWIMEE